MRYIDEIKHLIKGHSPDVLGNKKLSKFAVLLPLVEHNNEIHVLFEVRSHKLRRQPGDICFPGGRVDQSDSSYKNAAIRETKEELGVNIQDIRDVYPLDYLVSPFGMIVYTYVGFIQSIESINVNPAEVDDVFLVPLSYFLDHKPDLYHVHFKVEPDKDFPIDLIVGGENYDWRIRDIEEQFYMYEGKVIWGLTARILSHFIEVLHNN
ncbi:NUDIX hydrolase [Bacillus sp. AK128]